MVVDGGGEGEAEVIKYIRVPTKEQRLTKEVEDALAEI